MEAPLQKSAVKNRKARSGAKSPGDPEVPETPGPAAPRPPEKRPKTKSHQEGHCTVRAAPAPACRTGGFQQRNMLSAASSITDRPTSKSSAHNLGSGGVGLRKVASSLHVSTLWAPVAPIAWICLAQAFFGKPRTSYGSEADITADTEQPQKQWKCSDVRCRRAS